MIEPGTILADRYEIVEALGVGGMGTVFEAIDRRFGNRVAVKRLDIAGPAVERAFEREARLLRDLKHDGLPRVIDHFEHERSAYLVMDYVGGDDLSEALESRGRFSVEEVVDIARAVLGILEYLHGRTPPVLHRDIKPQNIKVHDGQVFLLDFGLAKGYASAREGVAGASSIAGYSPHYAPLEQIRGVGTDTWSDVYALAATTYCLLTGKRPADALERATAAATGETDPLLPASALNPTVPEPLSQLLIRAMSPNPTHRPRDAREMRSELERALALEGGVTIVETGHADSSCSNGTIIEPVAGTPHDRTLVAQPPTGPAARQINPLGRTAAWTVCLLLVTAIGVSAWTGILPWSSEPKHPSPLLAAGTAVERDIAPGELHEYHVVARTGDAIRVAVTRVEGRSFAVSIADESGRTPIEVRQGIGARIPVFWVARQDGVHVVAVRLSKNSGSGRYRIALENLGGATANDLRLLSEQASMLSAIAFAEEYLREIYSPAPGPGRPSDRIQRAQSEGKKKEEESKVRMRAATNVCRTSSEPAIRVWALDVTFDPPLSTPLIFWTDNAKAAPRTAAREELRDIFRGLGDIQGEAEYLPKMEAARLCAKAGFRTGEALFLQNSVVFKTKNDTFSDQEAKSRLSDALQIFRSLQDWEGVAYSAYWNANVRSDESLDERLPFYAEALESYRKINDTGWIAEVLIGRGRDYAKAGRFPESAADFEEAVGIYRNSMLHAKLIRTMRELASVLEKLGDRSRAETLLRESRSVDPELGTLNKSDLDMECLFEGLSSSGQDPLRF